MEVDYNLKHISTRFGYQAKIILNKNCENNVFGM